MRYNLINDMPKGWVNGKGQPKWHRVAYDMWRQLWNRCLSDDLHDIRPNYRDCNVCPSWMYLSKFIQWLISQESFSIFTQEPKGFCIDKDIILRDNKIYCPEYCTLTTIKSNSVDTINRSKTKARISYIGIPLDNKEKIIILRCGLDASKHGFQPSHVRNCSLNRIPHHKYYKWYRLNYKHNKTLRFKFHQG